MKQTINRIGLVIILTIANANMAQATHSTIQDDISWFTSSTSSLLNRSSMDLATKHLNRGIKIAHQAIENQLNPADRLIANHNLCIGYLAADKAALASQYCASAHDLAQGSYRVAKIRGAFRLQAIDIKNSTDLTLTPSQVLVRNIQIQSTETRLALLMK
jgi:hypothetical protein